MKHEISFLSSAHPRLLPRSGPHQTCSSGPHAARSDGAPVCSCLPEPSHKQAESGPDKPELAQIWAALHFYFSGLDPASSGLFSSLLAETWDQVCSDLANRSEWPGCHHSPRCVGRINASYTILIKPPQPAVRNSYKQHFNVSSVSDSREDTEARLHHVEYLRNFSTCRHETLERLWSRRRRLLTLVTPWFFMCSRQKIKVNNFLKLQRLVD